MSYLHSLSVFFAVVENKSFSAAAKQLNLTQPTVSFHIDNLEKKFGCPLFTRTAKGVSLTVYGQTLYQKTYKIHDIMHVTENKINAMVEGSAGHIVVGASTIPGEYILPALVAKFLKTHTGIKLSLKTGNSSSILEAYRCGELPIAIVGVKPKLLEATALWQDELLLVAHPEIGQSFSTHASVDEVAKYPYILREATSGTRGIALETLVRHGIAPDQLNVVLEVASNQALKAAILNKAGIGFISKWAVEAELAYGSLMQIKLPGFHIERQFYGIHTSPLLPKCLEVFWQYLTNNARYCTVTPAQPPKAVE